MKRIILILAAIVLTFNSYSQVRDDITMASDAVMSADTSFTKYVPDNQTWGLTVSWDSLTGTLDGVLKIKVSDDGVNFANYATLDSVTIADTTSFAMFEDVYFAHKFIKLDYTKNSITYGKINALLILKPRQ